MFASKAPIGVVDNIGSYLLPVKPKNYMIGIFSNRDNSNATHRNSKPSASNQNKLGPCIIS